MSQHTQDKPPWKIRQTPVQHWTDTPVTCPVCQDQTCLLLDIDGERVCDELEITCDQAAIPAMAAYIREQPELPGWARYGELRLHDPQETPHNPFVPGPIDCRHEGILRPNSVIAGLNHTVFIDNAALSPQRSLEVQNHSPSGFAWGYRGSGPSQLALALLLEAGASDREASLYHHELKDHAISPLPDMSEFRISGAVVTDWLQPANPSLE